MTRILTMFVAMVWLMAIGPARADVSAAHPANNVREFARARQEKPQQIDGVAARVEDDIIADSEVRELAAFQQLVDGQSKPRADLVRELIDQWIVRGEADAAKYPPPTEDDVQRAYEHLVAQFPSSADFTKRCASVGINEAAIRRILKEQLYLSHFLDYRFRPAAQVDQKQIENYYDTEFAPQLQARHETVPPIDNVQDTIREVLIQRIITERSNEWLEETRARLRIDVLPQGDSQ